VLQEGCADLDQLSGAMSNLELQRSTRETCQIAEWRLCTERDSVAMWRDQDLGDDDEETVARLRASPVGSRSRSFASSPTGSQGGRSPTSPRMVSAGDGHENTSTMLCQPLMDAVSQNPIGVLEFRRVQQDREAVESFTVLDQELAYHLSVLLVHAMVNHSKRLKGEDRFSGRVSTSSFGRSPSSR
jgi:hypothetical protein